MIIIFFQIKYVIELDKIFLFNYVGIEFSV